ncbi:MAG: glycosyltransferase family 4 protein [Candidatus Omnitrophica bacterium]|nr:glycosyltransferase family 4 protein [Candidatus Omnitrophota bacterium]
MKILLLTNHLNAGGITTYVLSLAKGLKEKGHLVKVASRGGEKLDVLKSLGIEHIFLNIFTKSEISPKIFWAKRNLCSILEKEGMDLLHAQTRLTRVISRYVQKRLNLPFVSTAHGFYKKRISHKIFPHWGKGVIAISKAVEKHLKVKFGLEGIKIKVIYNGVEMGSFKKSEKEINGLRNNFGLSRGPVIGIISRLAEIKGHFYLIRAMKYVLEKIPSAQLLIVGEGKIRNLLLRLIKDLEMEKSVFLVSSISDKSLIFSLMDIFVLPSLEEGLGMVLLEAMAFGIPVVASNTGGISEIIQDGENGLLVLPRDEKGLGEAICRILEDDTLKNKLVFKGKQTIEEKFTLDNMVKETEDFYREILTF